MFVTSSFFSCLGPLVLGVALDSYGPRISSVLSITLIGLGCGLFGMSTKEHFPMFIPAMCMISFGGPGVLSATIHLCNLYPEWRATTTAFITGSFQLSFLVFYLFDQLAAHHNWSYRSLFLGYSLVSIANVLVSLAVWPDTPYDSEEESSALGGGGGRYKVSSGRSLLCKLSALHDRIRSAPSSCHRSWCITRDPQSSRSRPACPV